jgi:hypothetical protein
LYKGTESELILEVPVAALGVPYRTNAPGFLLWGMPVFPDFWLPTLSLVIEVNGAEHYTKAGLAHDAERTEKLRAIGLRVANITNHEALTKPWDSIAGAVRENVEDPVRTGLLDNLARARVDGAVADSLIKIIKELKTTRKRTG